MKSIGEIIGKFFTNGRDRRTTEGSQEGPVDFTASTGEPEDNALARNDTCNDSGENSGEGGVEDCSSDNLSAFLKDLKKKVGTLAITNHIGCAIEGEEIVGEQIGWRVWETWEGYLLSMNRMLWLPYQPARGHGVTRYNQNGIHAFKSAENALEYGGTVIGRVKLYGTVVEHEDGFRAEYAYPLDLYPQEGLSKNVLERLKSNYGL